MLLQEEGSDPSRAGVYFLTSADGNAWAYDTNFRLPPGPAGMWDSTKIYRATLAYSGGVYHIWYSALKTNSTDVWHIGRTTYVP